MAKIKKTNIFIIVLIIVIILIFVYFLIFNQEEDKIEVNEETLQVLTEEEIEALMDIEIDKEEINTETNERAGTFKVGSASGVYPKFVSGLVDPKRPKIGEEQYISIKLRDPDGIKQVKLEIKDKEKKLVKEIDLKLESGDQFEGHWSNSWVVENVEEEFRIVFLVENNSKVKNDLTYFMFTEK